MKRESTYKRREIVEEKKIKVQKEKEAKMFQINKTVEVQHSMWSTESPFSFFCHILVKSVSRPWVYS